MEHMEFMLVMLKCRLKLKRFTMYFLFSGSLFSIFCAKKRPSCCFAHNGSILDNQTKLNCLNQIQLWFHLGCLFAHSTKEPTNFLTKTGSNSHPKKRISPITLRCLHSTFLKVAQSFPINLLLLENTSLISP